MCRQRNDRAAVGPHVAICQEVKSSEGDQQNTCELIGWRKHPKQIQRFLQNSLRWCSKLAKTRGGVLNKGTSHDCRTCHHPVNIRCYDPCLRGISVTAYRPKAQDGREMLGHCAEEESAENVEWLAEYSTCLGDDHVERHAAMLKF